MKITIENQTFDTNTLTQLYPAAIIKTGYKDETTQVSLEWLEVESKGLVEVVGYGIFVHEGEEKHSFLFSTRQEMDKAVKNIASQIN
jgi:hypothetical protein